MCDGEKNADMAKEKPAKSKWTVPVLVACGNMMNVLLDYGSGGDASGGSGADHS